MNLTFHFAMLVDSDSDDTTTVVSNAIPRDSHPKFTAGEVEKSEGRKKAKKQTLAIHRNIQESKGKKGGNT